MMIRLQAAALTAMFAVVSVVATCPQWCCMQAPSTASAVEHACCHHADDADTAATVQAAMCCAGKTFVLAQHPGEPDAPLSHGAPAALPQPLVLTPVLFAAIDPPARVVRPAISGPPVRFVSAAFLI